jgi:hypothetical protein
MATSVLWPPGAMGARLDDCGIGRQSNLAPVCYLGIDVDAPLAIAEWIDV